MTHFVKTHIRSLPYLALGTIACFFLSHCQKKSLSLVDQYAKKNILLIGNGTEPQDLDPQIVTGVPEHKIISALFEGLTAPNPKTLIPEPAVAQKWTIAKDLKTYTFYLRKNALWSNGDPVTAEDFLYAWKRLLSPKLAAEYAYMLFYLKNAKAYYEGKIKDFSKVGVKVINPHTLKVTLEYPTPYFLSITAFYSTFPVHKKTIEKFGKIDTRGSLWTRPGNLVGNGPFVLKRWKLNKVIEVTKNPKYWDAKNVSLKAIHFLPIDSEQTEERTFRAGRLHISNTVPINKIEVYQKKHPQWIRIAPYLGNYFYRLNVKKKGLIDKRVRHALSLAINRTSLVKNVLKGGQLPAYSLVPPNLATYQAPNSPIEFNPKKAQALLKEAGFPNGKGFPHLNILYNSNESHKIVAEAIQQMWKKYLNIKVELSNQDWKVYLKTVHSQNYDIARAGWIGDYPDPNTFLDMFLTGGGNNETGWSNKTYDMLIEKAGRTQNPKKRMKIFQKAESIFLDESPIIPIYFYTRLYLITAHVEGWYTNLLDIHPYKYVSLNPKVRFQKK